VREIFRYPKRDNLSIASHRKESVFKSAVLKRMTSLTRRRFSPSQFFHLCRAWEIGWLFRWSQQLGSMNRSCGLLERLDPDVEFNLIKDESFRGNEPDCETNHKRPERE